MNELTSISFECADVFRHLADLVAVRRQFDVVVLDPPKFARNRAAVPEALKGYRRLHQLALKLLARDGLLVSCCCSGLIAVDELEDVIAQVAVESKHDLQILARRGAAPRSPYRDHLPRIRLLEVRGQPGAVKRHSSRRTAFPGRPLCSLPTSCEDRYFFSFVGAGAEVAPTISPPGLPGLESLMNLMVLATAIRICSSLRLLMSNLI